MLDVVKEKWIWRSTIERTHAMFSYDAMMLKHRQISTGQQMGLYLQNAKFESSGIYWPFFRVDKQPVT